jgi:hypothetical protein
MSRENRTNKPITVDVYANERTHPTQLHRSVFTAKHKMRAIQSHLDANQYRSYQASQRWVSR